MDKVGVWICPNCGRSVPAGQICMWCRRSSRLVLKECIKIEGEGDNQRIVSRPEDWQPPEIEESKLTKWNWMVQHVDGLVLGQNVDIGAYCYLNARNGLTIEDNVQIGSCTSIYTISTIDGKEGPVVLRKNCKIGSHCVIMPGVTIGENAIVGAMSFVNKDVPADSIVWGKPASVKGRIKDV